VWQQAIASQAIAAPGPLAAGQQHYAMQGSRSSCRRGELVGTVGLLFSDGERCLKRERRSLTQKLNKITEKFDCG